MNKENSDTYSVACRCPRLLVFVLAAALVFGAVCVGGVSGADGNWDDYADTTWYSDSKTTFTITTAEQLAGLAKIVNGEINGVYDDFSGDTIYLGDDIDLKGIFKFNVNDNSYELIGREWTPIGKSDDYPFKGTFDGKMHHINNLGVSKVKLAGLFGYVDSGTIQNVFIMTSYLNPANKGTAGSIVAWLHDGVVSNCSVVIDVHLEVNNNGMKNYDLGGLIGKITYGSRKNTVLINDIGKYLKGDCSVTTATTNSIREWGLLVGEPNIGQLNIPGGSGGSGGTVDDKSAIYTVQYFMEINGDYVQIGSDADNQFVSVIGNIVTAEYDVPDHYFLGENSVLSGTVDDDPLLVLKVYYNYTIYTVQIPSTLSILEEKNGRGSIDILVLDLNIPSSSAVNIYIDGDFELEYQDSQTVSPLNYEILIGDSHLSTSSFVGNFTMAEHPPLKLTAVLLDSALYSGTYSDTLTFTYGLDLIM